MTPILAVVLIIIGACVGAGTLGLCVAARHGDDVMDVAVFLESVPFSVANQGRDVQLSRRDFNRLARLAAKANEPRAWAEDGCPIKLVAARDIDVRTGRVGA